MWGYFIVICVFHDFLFSLFVHSYFLLFCELDKQFNPYCCPFNVALLNTKMSENITIEKSLGGRNITIIIPELMQRL